MVAKRAKTSRSPGKPPAKAARKQAAGKPAERKRAAKPARKAPAGKGRAAPRLKNAPVTGLLKVVQSALEDIKAINVSVLDVRELTDIADTLVIASGTSDRHVRSIADRVVEFAKKAGFRPMGVEGERVGEWVLVDLQDVIVHIMLPRVREFYRLESLWDVSAARREAAAGGE
jgi:ribosome-associated protein